MKWRKTVKALGVHFSYNNEESMQKNFYDKLRGIKSQIRLWSWRGLSLFGKNPLEEWTTDIILTSVADKEQ